MKVITLTQPWATLVAIEEKRIETRSWRTDHRGLLGIHAALGFPKWARELCSQEPFKSVLARYGYTSPDQLPTGALIATCSLAACLVITRRDVADLHFTAWHFGRDFWDLTEQERAFGDYEVGRYAWLLRLVEPLETPIKIGGKLGLWNYDKDVHISYLADQFVRRRE